VGKLSELLAKGRKDSGLSLRESAALCGVNNSYISQLERGVEFDVSPNKLHALAELFNLSYTELMLAAGYVVPVCPECGVKL
jgi:transcriptional regulator with XRE-family HTH domain